MHVDRVNHIVVVVDIVVYADSARYSTKRRRTCQRIDNPATKRAGYDGF